MRKESGRGRRAALSSFLFVEKGVLLPVSEGEGEERGVGVFKGGGKKGIQGSWGAFLIPLFPRGEWLAMGGEKKRKHKGTCR